MIEITRERMPKTLLWQATLLAIVSIGGAVAVFWYAPGPQAAVVAATLAYAAVAGIAVYFIGRRWAGRGLAAVTVTRERALKILAYHAVLCAMLIFGGRAVLSHTPGPEAAAIVAMIGYAVVVAIAMYFPARRWVEGADTLNTGALEKER